MIRSKTGKKQHQHFSMFHFFVPKLTPNFFGAAEKKFDYPMTSLFKEKKSLEILEEKEMKIFSSRNWDKNALKWKLGSWIIFFSY